jgi:hypothetical protein
MAKLEYSGECRCGGKIKTMFKKPTRFQPSIARAKCQGCKSDFLFTCLVEYSDDGQRAYMPTHKVTRMTPALKEALKLMKNKTTNKETTNETETV